NQIQVASTTPPSVVSTPPASAAPPTVTATSASSSAAAGQAPVDVTGTVARYDAQTAIVTLEDGRMVRISSTASVWQAQRAADIRPGQQLYIRNGVPVGVQAAVPVGVPPSVVQSAASTWHYGTVSRVDIANNTLYLTDGTAVQIQPATRLEVNGQPIALSQIQPGAQVAVLLPAAATSTLPPTSSAGANALPRSAAGTPSSGPIMIFTAPANR